MNSVNISKKTLAYIIIAIATTFGVFLFFEYTYNNRFYPGIYVDGRLVGGKTYTEVFNEYKKGAEALDKDGITLIFESEKGERIVNIPMEASGMSPDRVVAYFSLGDWEGSLREAYDYGRNGNILTKIFEQANSLIKNKEFNFPAVFQSEAISSFYSREIKGYFKETISSNFVYVGNKIYVSKESACEDLDFSEVSQEIEKKLSSFDPSPIRLKAKTRMPSFSKEEMKMFLPVANEIAHGINVDFRYKSYGWKVSGKKLITWLRLDENGRLSLDKNKIKLFLNKNIIPVLDNRPMSSRFEVQGGKLIEIEKGRIGNMVDIEKTVAKVEEVIFGTKRSLGIADSMVASLGGLAIGNSDIIINNGYLVVPIEITEEEPSVTKDTVDEYNINELVGVATTNFKGSSADRIHNIKVGVSKLTGLLIAPGEEFSTVFSIGTTSEEEGFVAEFVIKEDKSIKELGGGLCQIATTLFRLALNTGLPITERVNHRYVVGYYGPGLDATIYDPHPDLRFINDTGKYLLLQGTVKDNNLIFEFFGQKDGRHIYISEPVLSDEKPIPETKYLMSTDVPYATQQCSETPRKGITAEVDYAVTYKNGKINEQKFKSIYQPWRKICLIGLGATIPLKK